jgi:zinc protease
VNIKDKEMTTLVGSHDLSMKDVDADYPAWVLVGQILGGDTGSRMWMRVREKEGLSYGVGAWTFAGVLDDAGGFGIYAIVAPQNLAKAKASMLDEVGKMAGGKVEADELARAKDAWIKQIDTNLSNDDFVTQMIENQLFRGRTAAYLQDLRKKVAAVTAADVERVAKAHLHPDHLVLVDAGDQAKAK